MATFADGGGVAPIVAEGAGVRVPGVRVVVVERGCIVGGAGRVIGVGVGVG